LDTYDNDNTGLHPLVIAIVNDGTKTFSHEHDAEAQAEGEMEIGNCQFHVRNLDAPSLIRVTYRGSTLTVETAITENDQFTRCVEATNIDLPTGYHFGFTAATGQLADNHDIYGLALRNLDMNARSIDSQRVYSQYDKYVITDQLSKLQFAVEALKEGAGVPCRAAPVPGTFVPEPAAAGGAQAPLALPPAMNDKLNLIDDVVAAVIGVNDIAEELKNGINAISNQANTVTKDISANKLAIDAVKRDVNQLLSNLRTLESNIDSVQRKLNERPREDKSVSIFEQIWSWVPSIIIGFAVVIFIIVILLVIIIVVKVKSDSRRKHF